jgi:hypothetical protein
VRDVVWLSRVRPAHVSSADRAYGAAERGGTDGISRDKDEPPCGGRGPRRRGGNGSGHRTGGPVARAGRPGPALRPGGMGPPGSAEVRAGGTGTGNPHDGDPGCAAPAGGPVGPWRSHPMLLRRRGSVTTGRFRCFHGSGGCRCRRWPPDPVFRGGREGVPTPTDCWPVPGRGRAWPTGPVPPSCNAGSRRHAEWRASTSSPYARAGVRGRGWRRCPGRVPSRRSVG